MKVTLLGPQEVRRTLKEAVERTAERRGNPLIITAGWQEREDQDQPIVEQLGVKCVNLRLYRRTETALTADKDLAQAQRARQDELRLMQDYYRLRLERIFEAALEIERKARGTPVAAAEMELSLDIVRRLDEEHLVRCRALWEDFDKELSPLTRPAIRAEREKMGELMDKASVVIIAGGHVAALLNRLRLFALGEFLKRRPIVAWSAGAMVLAERIVLFHENPPSGQGVSELLDRGFGVHRGILVFPNPRMRLRLSDTSRVEWVARRYEPLKCIAFDHGDSAEFDEGTWRALDGTFQLRSDGVVAREWAAS